MTYKVIFKKSAARELDGLSDGQRKALIKEIQKLETDATPSGSKELDGFPGIFRIRAGGARAVYDAPNAKNEIFILRVGVRKNVYEIDPTTRRDTR